MCDVVIRCELCVTEFQIQESRVHTKKQQFFIRIHVWQDLGARETPLHGDWQRLRMDFERFWMCGWGTNGTEQLQLGNIKQTFEGEDMPGMRA